MENNNNDLIETKVKKRVQYTLLRREVRSMKIGQRAISKDVKKIKGWMIRSKRSNTWWWWLLGSVANALALVSVFLLMVELGIPAKEAVKTAIGML